MKSAVIKRSIFLDGHKTSISLEDSFWTALREIAQVQGVTPSILVTTLAATGEHSNLSSAVRVFVLEHYRNKARPGVPTTHNAISGDERRSASFAKRG